MLVAIFNKLTKYRFANTSKRIKWEASRKNWEQAAELVKTIDDSKRSWLHRHVKECAKKSNALQQVFLKRENVESRVSIVSKGSKVLSTAPVYGGLISAGVFTHKIQEKSGNITIILEKAYDKRQKKLATLETLLFKEVDHKRLCAPAFLGTTDTENVLSVFYEYIHKHKIATAKAKIFPGIQKQLLERVLFSLWKATPTKNLLADTAMLAPERLSRIESMLSKPNITNLYDAVKSCKDKRLVDALYLNQEHYIEKFKSLPAFIMHGDLYNFSNIMIQSGRRFSIIDWDKWYVSHIGGGLRIKPEAFLNASLSKKIDHFCANNPHVSTHDLWVNVAIDNLANCLHQNDGAVALEWVKHLSEINKE